MSFVCRFWTDPLKNATISGPSIVVGEAVLPRLMRLSSASSYRGFDRCTGGTPGTVVGSRFSGDRQQAEGIES